MRRIAIGALLGLSDPTAEVIAVGLHGRYLMKQYWQSQLSVSLPRLRPAAGVSDVPHISDRQYVRYWLALRLFLPDAGFTLSSRESAGFRNRMMQICITQVSGGARTEPGGYSGLEATEQFSRDDTRSVTEMAEAIIAAGKEPVFTDWAEALK
jgi:2-iminoacetate synthase